MPVAIIKPIRILLADKQYLIREGMKCILKSSSDFELAGEVEDLEELEDILESSRPDVIVLDHDSDQFYAGGDISAFSDLVEKAGPAKFLIISADNDKERIRRMLEMGVCSFLTKVCGEDEIINAIYACTREEKFFCTKVLDILIAKPQSKDEDDCSPRSLSARETEIVRLIACGMTTPQMADELHLSPHTINTHRKNILRKLKLRSGSALVLYAVRTGLIQADLAS